MDLQSSNISFASSSLAQKSQGHLQPSETNGTQHLSSSNKSSHRQNHKMKRDEQLTRQSQKYTSMNKETRQAIQQTKKMHLVEIQGIKWESVDGYFSQKMKLKVQYSVSRRLEENINWKITYLGSAYSEKNDQILSQFETQEKQLVHAYPEKRQFQLAFEPPKWSLICYPELFNVTAVTISAAYKNQQFIKIGYYIHYQLPSLQKSDKQCLDFFSCQLGDQQKQDNQEKFSKSKKISKTTKKLQKSNHFNRSSSIHTNRLSCILSHTVRTILADKPRITKFNIQWQKTLIQDKYHQLSKANRSCGQYSLCKQKLITQYLKPLQSSMNNQQTQQNVLSINRN